MCSVHPKLIGWHTVETVQLLSSHYLLLEARSNKHHQGLLKLFFSQRQDVYNKEQLPATIVQNGPTCVVKLQSCRYAQTSPKECSFVFYFKII